MPWGRNAQGPPKKEEEENEAQTGQALGSFSHPPAYTGQPHIGQQPWGWLPAACLFVCLQFHQSLPAIGSGTAGPSPVSLGS